MGRNTPALGKTGLWLGVAPTPFPDPTVRHQYRTVRKTTLKATREEARGNRSSPTSAPTLVWFFPIQNARLRTSSQPTYCSKDGLESPVRDTRHKKRVFRPVNLCIVRLWVVNK
ncbi:hypothetical protein ElyMa_000954100 [Elysia marginata]|uniref:Uncharacterized protein n=1 Tax=Elysia marginata TaxID=1093978 RepID=A0AAV4HGW1_9GAST|nr:hypothetical protein ElyMa_000954100 [Elysia marginata]